MRFLNKYKLASRNTSVVAKTPLRVIKFNRPKWSVIKKKFYHQHKRLVRKIQRRLKKKSRLFAKIRSSGLELKLSTTSVLDKLKIKSYQLRLKKALKKAKKLLIKKELNVTEICYECDFNSLSWFIKSFKKEFGITPKQYQQNC